VNLVDPDFIYSQDEWVVQLCFFALLMAAGELGFRWGRYAIASAKEKKGKAPVSVIEGSLLGVLGLLLGFTMSMAVSRFERRTQLVLDEANAIGTTYLRAQLLPAPSAAEMASLLREYVAIRVQHANYQDPGQLSAGRREARELQTRLWNIAVQHARADANPFLAVQVVQSLNQVIDLDAARWMAVLDRVPMPVIYVNALVALFAAILAGYAFGIDGARKIFPMCVLGIAITVVLGVILDLDNYRRGSILVSQQPMIDLYLQLHSTAEKAAGIYTR
jgi:hypothetical protein